MDHNKNKERIEKFKETRDTRYKLQKWIRESLFSYDMSPGDFKNLAKGTASDIVS